MKIKPIETEPEYRAALLEIERLMAAKPGSPPGKQLDLVTTLVEAYETRHFPLDSAESRQAAQTVPDCTPRPPPDPQ